MAYKILTKNGIENTNIDGARENFFNTGMRDGVVQGVLNEGKFESNSSNSIYIDSCELRIAGHRILIDEPVYKTFSNTPNNDIRYSMVAQIVVTDNGDVAFSLFVQSVETVLIKDNLYATTTGQGTYQVEIGRFTLTTDGTIEDVVKTIDTITGATESIAGGINIGNVTTEKIDYKFNAEVDVNQRYDSQQKKTFTDFNFQLPLDVTDIELKANNAEQVANEAKTSANAAVGTANTALDTANTAESNSSDALTNSQNATQTAENAVNIANTANTKSDNAVNIANEALDKVTTNQGTVVTVGGEAQTNWSADTKVEKTTSKTVGTHTYTANIDMLESGATIRMGVSYDDEESTELEISPTSAKIYSEKHPTGADIATIDDIPTTDDALSTTSENPVQNKVVTTAINTAQNTADGAVSKNTEQDTSILALQTADGQNVKLTGDQSVGGVKNFTGTLKIAGKDAVSIEEIGEGYIRYGDGTQICHGREITPTTGANSITFPKPFIETPSVCGTFEGGASTQNYYSYIIKGSLTTTGFQIKGFKNEYCDYIAIGKWK